MKRKWFKVTEKMLAEAHTTTAFRSWGKLTTEADGRQRIISDPLLVEPVEDTFASSGLLEVARWACGRVGPAQVLLRPSPTQPGQR